MTVTQLDDARRLLDAGDAHGALRPLERAREDLLAGRDLDGLQELRRLAERGYSESHDRDEAAYESLLYASAQNIRWLSRKRALERGVPWEDPHPELDAPGRPEMRVEREVTKRDLPKIVVFGGLGAALVVGLVAAWVWGGVKVGRGAVRATVVNDTHTPILVGTCNDPCHHAGHGRRLAPGRHWSVKTTADFFLVTSPNGHRLGCVETVDAAWVTASSAGSCRLPGFPP